MVKSQYGMGSCNFDDEKLDTIDQGVALSADGHKHAYAEYQEGRITVDCLAGLKYDAERRQFLIANTNWFRPE
jgi:hypothetical protein